LLSVPTLQRPRATLPAKAGRPQPVQSCGASARARCRLPTHRDRLAG
jgi:hypothetical protein